MNLKNKFIVPRLLKILFELLEIYQTILYIKVAYFLWFQLLKIHF